MKLSFRDIEPFVKRPDPAARVVLVYGPDNGLMKERAGIIGKTVVADLNDPFNAVTLSADQLSEDPARLADEAGAMSMMGGARLIRIEDGADKLTPLIKEYLELPSDQNLVVIEAGELGTKSSLRKLCESAKNAAALPCYVEDERGVSGIIRDMLREAGMGADPDAVSWLASVLTGDRARARAEIDKLVTYMGPGAGGKVTLADAQACCGGVGDGSLDDLVYGTGGGQSALALKSYTRLLEEGVPVIVVLRSLQNHFRRLHQVKAAMQEGNPMDVAMKTLSPPIFFKQADQFKAQTNRWSMPGLQKAMARVAEIEAQCKQTGTPVETLCGQMLLGLSKMKG
ncbi:MAG: DNA polymerase III subunit delta [Rhodospirillales bacterium]|nr:DNA polymerase III subunit delta [Rhodospirillales bacterium]